MHRCRRSPEIFSLRRRTISKIAALFLVTLSLLPFSAPFKTLDFASSHSDDASPGSVVKDKVDGDEASLCTLDETLIPPQLKVVVVTPLTRANQLEEHQFSHTVLRL